MVTEVTAKVSLLAALEELILQETRPLVCLPKASVVVVAAAASAYPEVVRAQEQGPLILVGPVEVEVIVTSLP